jgi:hypothetical protein
MLVAKKLSEKYGIPYVIDFRDSYIDERDKSYYLFLKKRIQHAVLKNAAALLFATDGMKDFFYKKAGPNLNHIPFCIVYNGVEEVAVEDKANTADDLFLEQFQEIKATHDLVLLHTGTVYAGQNINFFVAGLEAYNKLNDKKAAIVFLGMAENRVLSTQGSKYVFYIPKVKHTTAMLLQKEADALLLPIWDGRYTGFSGKTLEYLHSENVIITSPNPQSDLLPFFELSSNVFVTKNQKDFLSILMQISKKDIVKKALADPQKLYRKYWVQKLATFLSEIKK